MDCRLSFPERLGASFVGLRRARRSRGSRLLAPTQAKNAAMPIPTDPTISKFQGII
jgi:hypothetical protein